MALKSVIKSEVLLLLAVTRGGASQHQQIRRGAAGGEVAAVVHHGEELGVVTALGVGDVEIDIRHAHGTGELKAIAGSGGIVFQTVRTMVVIEAPGRNIGIEQVGAVFPVGDGVEALARGNLEGVGPGTAGD